MSQRGAKDCSYFVLKCPCYAHVEVHNFIFGRKCIHLHDLKFKKHFIFLILCIAAAPLFTETPSSLIGQLAQSVVIDLPLIACVGNVTPLTVIGFQLLRIHELL